MQFSKSSPWVLVEAFQNFPHFVIYEKRDAVCLFWCSILYLALTNSLIVTGSLNCTSSKPELSTYILSGVYYLFSVFGVVCSMFKCGVPFRENDGVAFGRASLKGRFYGRKWIGSVVKQFVKCGMVFDIVVVQKSWFYFVGPAGWWRVWIRFGACGFLRSVF